jgi:cytochrome c oxidase assembly protein subunit 15
MKYRLSQFLVLATLALLFIGGLVTSTDSGLAVPDWPLSYGTLTPPMIGGIRFEHTHRVVAAAVGFLTLVLTLWIGIKEKEAQVRRLAIAALAAVVTQGILGGMTVLHRLPAWISILHALLML